MSKEFPFITVEQAIRDFAAGKMLILIDDESRENEGDLIIAAEHVTSEAINFMSQFGRGLICMPLHATVVEQLHLPMMVAQNRSKQSTPFTVSIGAATGITTGISVADRAHTIRVAIDPQSTLQSIVSPGHVFPLAANPGGVLKRRGHTEGCIDLTQMAGLRGGAALCEIMNPDGSMARLPALIEFAKEHQLGILSIEDLVQYRLQHETLLTEAAAAKMPIENIGEFTLKVFVSDYFDQELVVLHTEKLAHPPLVRIHSQCFTGDLLGSQRCDCGAQLHQSLKKIHEEGGILLYMPQEGRGIGLVNKIKAYALQDQGLDTVEANDRLGLPIDSRDYAWCAQLFKTMGIDAVRLLTNNPRKIEGLEKYGIQVLERLPLEMAPNPHNQRYLETKRDKLGHFLSCN